MKTKTPFLRNRMVAIILLVLSLIMARPSTVAHGQPATAPKSEVVSLENRYVGSVNLLWAAPGIYSDTLTEPTNKPDLGSIDLGFLANCSGGTLSGYVDLSATLVFPKKDGFGPAIDSTKSMCNDDSLYILSKEFKQTINQITDEEGNIIDEGQTVTRQFQLSGTLDLDTNTYKGEYRETLWGYGPQPFTIVGDFTLELSTPETRGEQEYTLTVSSNHGTVTRNPDLTALPTYHKGDAVQLTAVAETGWRFTHWSGDASGTTNPVMVIMDGNKAVTANFIIDAHTLTVRKSGNTGFGTVTSSPVGIICGSTCSKTFNHGTVVTLTATPAAGSAFAGWSGACTGVSTCKVTMTAAKSVKALFKKEVVKNGGFNLYPTFTPKIPAYWMAVNFSTADGKDITLANRKEGAAAVKVTGAIGKTKTLTQTLTLAGTSSMRFTLLYWIKGRALPTAGLCQVQVFFYNISTEAGAAKTLPCGLTGTFAYKPKTISFNALGTFDMVKIVFTYSKASGTLWIDGLSFSK